MGEAQWAGGQKGYLLGATVDQSSAGTVLWSKVGLEAEDEEGED